MSRKGKKMLSAKVNESRVVSLECKDRNLDYRCPMCGEKVILKKGKVKIAHFAHEAHSACEASGETLEHLKAKAWIYQNAKKDRYVDIVEAECSRFEGIRPDVAIKLKGSIWIGFEVQRSGISEDDIRRRNRIYAHHGILVLWIATESVYKNILKHAWKPKPEVRLSAQCRLFNTLHENLVTFSGDSLLGFSFQTISRLREEYEYGEPSGSFYYEDLKTIFQPTHYKELHSKDFKGNRDESVLKVKTDGSHPFKELVWRCSL